MIKENKEAFGIVLILLILIGLAYKPFKDSKSGKSNSSGFSVFGTNKNSSDTPNTSENKTSENIKDVQEEIERLEKNIQKNIELQKRSPFYDKVRMSQISGVHGVDPSKEYFTLSTNFKNNEMVNVTGWYLKSEVTGYGVVIGQAALLPFPFTRADSNIVLQKGDKVTVVKGFSPIGISFRTNKCTGYFEENRKFTPSLPLSCPQPEDENLPRFSTDYDRNDECIELIERVPRCTTVGNEDVRDLPDTVGSFCKDYMKTQINYNACVAYHFDDTDFPGNQYRVYLNKFGPLWRPEREEINLHDQNGLIVDTITF